MSIYSQYADAVRESQVTWDRAVEVFTDNAKTLLGQAEQSFASALEVDPSTGAFDYLKRNLDAQREVSRRFTALSAQFGERVTAQGESLANAARDYATGAQEVLRDQAGKQYDEFAAARQRAEDAVRHGSPAAAPAAAAAPQAKAGGK